MDRIKRIWYLSPMRAAKVQASLRIHAVSPEPLLLAHTIIQAVSQEEPSDRKPDPWPLWMAGHAQLKFVMTECSKTQIRLTGLKSKQIRNRSHYCALSIILWWIVHSSHLKITLTPEFIGNSESRRCSFISYFLCSIKSVSVGPKN